MKEIKHIKKSSLANITALIYGFIGFFAAMATAISIAANIVVKKDFQDSVFWVFLFNLGAGLLFGVLSAVLTALAGWIIGYIAAGIYNWFAKKVGGIKIELADEYKAETEERLINS